MDVREALIKKRPKDTESGDGDLASDPNLAASASCADGVSGGDEGARGDNDGVGASGEAGGASHTSRGSRAKGTLRLGVGSSGGPPLYPNRSTMSRLRVEKIEGGLMVAGVVVAANCQIILPIFGFLFLLVGCVLTAASYRGMGPDEEPDHYAHRIAFTGNSRILGPACIVVGFLMFVAGCTLCLLTKRARRREQTVGFHCPLHGDFYPIGTKITSSKTIAAIEKGSLTNSMTTAHALAAQGALYGGRNSASGGAAPNHDSSGRLTSLLCCRSCACQCWSCRTVSPDAMLKSGVLGAPQCPHSQVSSTRSSLADSSPHSQCPTPLPFVVTSSGSIGGLVPTVAQLSPDQPFGSIRSLAVSREVASFPLSRTPTPPVSKRESLQSPHLVQVPDEERLVGSAHSQHVNINDEDDDEESAAIVHHHHHQQRVADVLHHTTSAHVVAGPRKSVSIVLPDEEDVG